MRKKIVYLLICLMIIMAFSTSVLAHSGRTDSNGGHHDNKNKSGLGSYHYHHGYEAHLHPGGVCPYSNNSVTESYTPSPSISLKKYPKELYVGETSGIEFTVTNATDNEISISSSDSDIVRVNSDNTLSAIGAGTAEITISASDVTKSFTIKIKSIPVESVDIINKIEELQLGEVYSFNAVVVPENATNQKISWESSDENILKITDDGKIEAKSVGTATVTCNAANDIKTQIDIEVFEVFPEKISVSYDNIELENGENTRVEIEILPSNANNKSYDISILDEGVATINEDLVINSVNDGNTILIIKTTNNIKKEIPITVYHNPVESISIDDSQVGYIFTLFSNNTIDVLEDLKLDAKVAPDNATFKTINWKSSDPNIISVKNGQFGNKFEIKGTGKVTLTAIGYDNVEKSISFIIVDKNMIIVVIIACVGCCISAMGIILYKKKYIVNGK